MQSRISRMGEGEARVEGDLTLRRKARKERKQIGSS